MSDVKSVGRTDTVQAFCYSNTFFALACSGYPRIRNNRFHGYWHIVRLEDHTDGDGEVGRENRAMREEGSEKGKKGGRRRKEGLVGGQ